MAMYFFFYIISFQKNMVSKVFFFLKDVYDTGLFVSFSNPCRSAEDTGYAVCMELLMCI